MTISKRAGWAVVIAIAGVLSGQYLAQAADSGGRAGNFVVTSSTATNTVTDLWVLDQQNRTVYLCRSSGSSGAAPSCSKGMQLP
ncbi:MAG: hypothetical protein H0U63_02245 [Burkholderiales bacterium]|nr:hypothetical protein [Burkholderiales bacterium]